MVAGVLSHGLERAKTGSPDSFTRQLCQTVLQGRNLSLDAELFKDVRDLRIIVFRISIPGSL